MAPEVVEDPLTGIEPDRLSRAFLLGSARGALDGEAKGRDPLTLLALLSQRLRFSRRGLPRLVPTGRRLPPSPVPITPPPIRAALLRLFESTSRNEPQDLTSAGLQAVVTAGFRLHPFDLPRLATRLAGKQELLGPVEQSYLAFHRSRSEPAEETGRETELTSDNWTTASKQRRLEFIRALRLSDPDAARGLIEQAFSTLRAPVRAELVGVLALRLTPADRPFLEGLAGDRAPLVRAAVSGILAQIPGSEAYASRLREALAMISLTRAGLLKTRKTIKVTPPSLPEDQIEAALRERLRGVSLTAILSALNVPVAELERLIDGVDHHTAVCLLWASLAEGNLDQVAAVAVRSGLPITDILAAIEPDLEPVPIAARRVLIRKLLDVAGLAATAAPLDFARLRSLLGGPLDEPQAGDLLDAATWESMAVRAQAIEVPLQAAALVAAAAALIPASRGALLRSRLAPLPPDIAAAPMRFSELLMAIAAASSTSPDPSTPSR